jgi:hypothetical protein
MAPTVRHLLDLLLFPSEDVEILTGNYLRDSLLRWLLPPDPSTNHNIACKAQYEGTAEWFFQGNIFNGWKSTGSFLWIHGKRASFVAFTARQLLIFYRLHSGLWQEHPLVRPSSTHSTLRTDIVNSAPQLYKI